MSEKDEKAEEAPDEYVPFSEENEALWQELKQVRPNNNIHHVVPVGVLVVLFTLYLSALALQKNCEANSSLSQSLQVQGVEGVLGQDAAEQQCQPWLLKEAPEEAPEEDSCLTTTRIDGDGESQTQVETSGDSENGGNERTKADKTSGNGNGKKPLPRKLSTKRKSKKIYSHKYHNKSAKAKGVAGKKSSTKRANLDEPRKTSAAEPIIYLCALVFIYLLLKAASDINQHYKSRNKGDKRMRRCSLQSYAQTHRQDRRASKEFGGSASKPNQGQRPKYMCPEARSQSFDPHTSLHKSLDYVEKKQRILANLRQYTSVDGQTSRNAAPNASPPRLSAAASLHESAPHLSPVRSARRCSMPVAMLTQPLSTAPPTCADRRVSLGMGPSPDPLSTDVKRRVRMINRH